MENTNKVQAENARLKDKARDMEYYKKRYEVCKTCFLLKKKQMLNILFSVITVF